MLARLISLWRDRGRWNALVLGVLLVILAGAVGVRLLLRETVPAGALNRVVCVACGAQMDMVVDDIDDPKYICPQCRQGKLAHLWKCEDCHFEYPLVPRPIPRERVPEKTMAKFRAAMEMQRCPNCGSLSTAAVAAD